MTNPSEEQLTALATSELSALKEAAEEVLSASLAKDHRRRIEARGGFNILANPQAILSLIHSLATVTAENGKLREALEQIEEVGTRTTTTRVGDMYDPNGYDDNTTVSEEAEIARSLLHPNTGAGS